MRRDRLMTLVAVMVVGSTPALADDDLDVTMRMVTDEEPLGDTVVRQIELPRSASERAHEMAAPGLERAEEASERGREAAEAARERGREARERGREARESAREGKPDARDSRGQGAGGNRPEVPSPD